MCLLSIAALYIGSAESVSPAFAALLGTWETQGRTNAQNFCYPCRFIIQDVTENGDILGQFLRDEESRPFQAKVVRKGERIEVDLLFLATGNRVSLALDGSKYLSGWGASPTSMVPIIPVQFRKVL
jgi:hypothetical protein